MAIKRLAGFWFAFFLAVSPVWSAENPLDRPNIFSPALAAGIVHGDSFNAMGVGFDLSYRKFLSKRVGFVTDLDYQHLWERERFHPLVGNRGSIAIGPMFALYRDPDFSVLATVGIGLGLILVGDGDGGGIATASVGAAPAMVFLVPLTKKMSLEATLEYRYLRLFSDGTTTTGNLNLVKGKVGLAFPW